MGDTADREIVVSHVVDAPREIVFEAFTDIRHLSRWWGPDGFTTTTRSFEFRVGGEWDFMMHGPDGTHYRMTPAQRKQANALIRRECCNCEDGGCIALDDGDTCTCPQMISFSVCCKWFRWSVLPQIGTLEAEIFRDKELKRCAVCGRVFVPKSNRAKYCPDCAARVHRRQKAESERKRRSSVDN